MEPQRIAGMAWYCRETYEQCLALFADADDLPGTYDEWLVLAEQAEQETKLLGWEVRRAVIDPHTFPRWCAEHGYAQIDSQTRIAFADAVAAG